MPIITSCPSCSRKLRVPDELLGKAVKCPTCSQTFDVPELPEVIPVLEQVPSLSLDDPAPMPPPASPGNEQWQGRPQHAGKEKMCPSCRNQIRQEETRCRFCGEELAAPPQFRPWGRTPADDGGWGTSPLGRRDWEPHRGNLILVLGILSLVVPYAGLALGIFAWVLGQNDLQKMRRQEMDPEGRSTTQGGWICGIIGTIMQGGMTLCCGLTFIPAMLS